jgi:hypothetical protein
LDGCQQYLTCEAFMAYLRKAWSQSKVYRVVLIAVLAYTSLRLAVHGVYLAGTLLPEQAEEHPIPVDLQVYLDAATHFQLQQDLYPRESLELIEYHYPYPPAYAMMFVPFLWLPPLVVSVIHTLLHIVAYGLLYIWWGRVFRRLGLDLAGEMWAWTFPVWLVFSAFWSDLGYLNIYIISTLLATLLVDTILNERLGRSLLWLSIILQTKPMWAFAIAIPLFLGRYRFFLRLLALAAVIYVAIAGTTILLAGPSYGWQQYIDYIHLLSRLGHDFPWRGPDAPFLGYNHSIKQIVVYLLGLSPEILRLAPLAVASLRHLLRPACQAGREVPRLSLDLAFALYLGVFIWLDIVWELSLGIAVFTYLLATVKQRGAKICVWLVFLPYALVDFWQLASFIAFGPNVVLPGPYVLTDPSIYIPLIMIVILTFYALLVKRLWTVPARQMRPKEV